MNKNTFIFAVKLLLLLFLGYFGFTFIDSFFGPGLKIVSSDSIVHEMWGLNRLETAKFTMEKIIDAGYNGNFFQNILYGDRILLVAHAEVIAGFDLSRITKNDVIVTYSTEYDDHSNKKDYKVSITLPPPEIFFSVLDNKKTRVYDRRTGLLAAYNKDLESTARAQAEIAIKNDACEAGILDTASKNATEQLQLLLKASGFGEVRIIIPEGTCN